MCCFTESGFSENLHVPNFPSTSFPEYQKRTLEFGILYKAKTKTVNSELSLTWYCEFWNINCFHRILSKFSTIVWLILLLVQIEPCFWIKNSWYASFYLSMCLSHWAKYYVTDTFFQWKNKGKYCCFHFQNYLYMSRNTHQGSRRVNGHSS